jgi:5-methyltetrahydropteroyltriglutamate--homocysteine methyltransferase
MKLIQTFKNEGYNSGIGPGLYDIHSPRVPSEEEMKEKVKTMLEILDANNFFINPDCGKY